MLRILIVSLVLTTSSRAGIYFGDAAPPVPRLSAIRSDILQSRAAAAVPTGPLDPDSPRARFQSLARRLEIAQDFGPFSTSDLVSLSACYLYLGRPTDAIRLLQRGDRTHFLVRANLATAYFLIGHYDLAHRYQSQLLRDWPQVAASWSSDDLVRCRVAERAFERLIVHRADEMRRGVNRDLPLDPIFPGFVVESPDGDYEAGVLSPTVRDRLPSDAALTLLQLLLWLPADQRLYWQMGEMLAALGQVELGSVFLEDLVNAGLDFKGLRRHRKVLKEAAEALRILKLAPNAVFLRGSIVLVGPSALPPGISGHVWAGSAFTAPIVVNAFQRDEDAAPTTVLVESVPSPTLPFNWRHIAVSFAFGFLVAALLGFQLQEWRRRAALGRQVQESNS